MATFNNLQPAVPEDEMLCLAWLDTKAQINKLQQQLDEISQALDGLVGHKREGKQSMHVGPYTVETTGNLYRKVSDWVAWRAAFANVPREQQPIKDALDETRFKRMVASDHELCEKLLGGDNPVVLETVGKTSVKVSV